MEFIVYINHKILILLKHTY